MVRVWVRLTGSYRNIQVNALSAQFFYDAEECAANKNSKKVAYVSRTVVAIAGHFFFFLGTKNGCCNGQFLWFSSGWVVATKYLDGSFSW